jgi:hypothetical protein
MSITILDMRLSMIRELPDDPDLYIEQLTLDGIQDLCRKTWCYVEPITLTSVKDQAIYPMTITTTDAQVIGFWQGKYNNITLPNVNNRKMDRNDSKFETRTGTPTSIIYNGGSDIRFNITPDTTGKAIQLEPVIMPTAVAATVPEKIELRHQEAVKSYVKWKVYEAPTKFFNVDLLKYYRADYEQKRRALKNEVAQDYIGNIEVEPRSFITGEVNMPVGFSLNE